MDGINWSNNISIIEGHNYADRWKSFDFFHLIKFKGLYYFIFNASDINYTRNKVFAMTSTNLQDWYLIENPILELPVGEHIYLSNAYTDSSNVYMIMANGSSKTGGMYKSENMATFT